MDFVPEEGPGGLERALPETETSGPPGESVFLLAKWPAPEDQWLTNTEGPPTSRVVGTDPRADAGGISVGWRSQSVALMS